MGPQFTADTLRILGSRATPGLRGRAAEMGQSLNPCLHAVCILKKHLHVYKVTNSSYSGEKKYLGNMLVLFFQDHFKEGHSNKLIIEHKPKRSEEQPGYLRSRIPGRRIRMWSPGAGAGGCVRTFRKSKKANQISLLSNMRSRAPL